MSIATPARTQNGMDRHDQPRRSFARAAERDSRTDVGSRLESGSYQQAR